MVLQIVLVAAAAALFVARLTLFARHHRPANRDNYKQG